MTIMRGSSGVSSAARRRRDPPPRLAWDGAPPPQRPRGRPPLPPGPKPHSIQTTVYGSISDLLDGVNKRLWISEASLATCLNELIDVNARRSKIA